MEIDIGRRQFMSVLGSAVAAWPLAAHSQQSAMPVVGFLATGTPEADADLAAAFRKGLSETGYVESRNVAIEYSWSENDNSRLPALADDFVRQRVNAIAAISETAQWLRPRRPRQYLLYFSFPKTRSGLVWSKASRGREAT